MAHHKRKRPKTSRAGCLMCKPHKSQRANGGKDRYRSRDARRLEDTRVNGARQGVRRDALWEE